MGSGRGKTDRASRSWLARLVSGGLRRGCACSDVMRRGVLDWQRLHGWIPLQQRNQARRDFLEEPLVILFYVCRRLPQRDAAGWPVAGSSDSMLSTNPRCDWMRGRNSLFSAVRNSFTLAGLIVQLTMRENMVRLLVE